MTPIASSGSAPYLSEARFATIVRYVGLKAHHIELLQRIAAEVAPSADEVTEKFYEHVRASSTPATSASRASTTR